MKKKKKRYKRIYPEKNIDLAGPEAEEKPEGAEGVEAKETLPKLSFGTIVKRALIVFLTTVVALLLFLTATVYILSKGPSNTATGIFVRSVRETSAIGFLANVFLSDEEVESYYEADNEEIKNELTDASLITVMKGMESQPSSSDIEILDIKGASFKGKLMIIKDPSRVFLGTSNSFARGQKLEDIIEENNAIGGVNGGGFDDPGGAGKGGTPLGVVICEGQTRNPSGQNYWTAAMDENNVLHVGWMNSSAAEELKARWAVSYGPALVLNGEKVDNPESGLNPRTAVGQRADGAILLLVIDGRQVNAIGASFSDTADVLLEYGAINALNLDGGSSSQMFYEGVALNSYPTIVGARDIPNAILVR